MPTSHADVGNYAHGKLPDNKKERLSALVRFLKNETPFTVTMQFVPNFVAHMPYHLLHYNIHFRLVTKNSHVLPKFYKCSIRKRFCPSFILSVLCIFSIFCRRYAGNTLEYLHEMLLIIIANLLANFDYLHICSL